MGIALRNVTLNDKYLLKEGTALMNGAQALVRACLMQRDLDARAGLNTAGFVSGYRGSPAGQVDFSMWSAETLLKAANIHFSPGVNEDLAATAVWGTQQLATMKDPTVDGVFALWYGKGPGVDRSGDPIKHGNYTGTHPNGGVLAVMADDHPGKSSTIAHHSEQAMASHSIPVLFPSSVQEFIEFGLKGWALSRYSGCWVGFKVVNETIEQTATVDVTLDNIKIERPKPDALPAEGVHYKGVYNPQADEIILKRYKLPLVHQFVRANEIDKIVLAAAQRRIGIVTAGKGYQDVMQALSHLGLDARRAASLGVSVYKVGCIWPIEPEGLKAFAEGHEELFFIEEKAGFMQDQAAAILYNLDKRPRIVGKRDEGGLPLVPSDVQLDPVDVALWIAGRLRALKAADSTLDQRLAMIEIHRNAATSVKASALRRLPYYCSGCPHNTSTNVPAGSQAFSGIGCHGMAIWAKPGTTLMGTHMGGEGLSWVALSRFTKTNHFFQNLGDGTYYHSGLLAIRAAIASGANITYKILFNDAVAMTGGQPHDGPLTVPAIANQVLYEGVKRIVVVTDEPEKYGQDSGLPAGVEVHHRDRLDAIQKQLREIPGCTVMIYDQTCAAEKRRRRKIGTFPNPAKRAFIYDPVCEGCGDCSTKSGCVSILPKETDFGRKRQIDQSNCNKDFSCIKGFCPSFVTVYGAEPKKSPRPKGGEAFTPVALPEPAVARMPEDGYGIMITGIGGTGVITVGAVLAMAAHLEGKAASAYDMTGLSQKNGAVFSHLKIGTSPDSIHAQRIGLGEASLVLGFDMIAAASDEAFRTTTRERTRFIGNSRVQPTAALNFDPDDRVDTSLLKATVQEKLDAANIAFVDATGAALGLLGDTIAANMFVVGFAAQKGWLPVSIAAIEKAIELNGVQVPFNKQALTLGRQWAIDPAPLHEVMRRQSSAKPGAVAQRLDEIVTQRAALLTDYQDAAYATRYRALVDRAMAAEARVAPGEDRLSAAVARYFAKVMAYKDEYEVARLYSDPKFLETIKAQFDGERMRLAFNLAPPLFARRDRDSGLPRKSEYGAWMLKVLPLLATLRRYRGTRFDVFGWTAERKAERALVAHYEALMNRLLDGLTPASYETVIRLAELPEQIRGFGHVKEASMAKVKAQESRLLAEIEGGGNGRRTIVQAAE